MNAREYSGTGVTFLERVGLLLGGGALLGMASAEIAFMGWLLLRVS